MRSLRTCLLVCLLVLPAPPATAQVRSTHWDFVPPSPTTRIPPREWGPWRPDTAASAGKLSRSHMYRSLPLAGALGLGGAVLGFVGGLFLFECDDENRKCRSGPEEAEYATGVLGLALGSAAGAHWGGLRADSRGHFGITLLAAGLAGSVPVLWSWDNYDATLPSLFAAPILAAVTDNIVRRPRRRAARP